MKKPALNSKNVFTGPSSTRLQFQYQGDVGRISASSTGQKYTEDLSQNEFFKASFSNHFYISSNFLINPTNLTRKTSSSFLHFLRILNNSF